MLITTQTRLVYCQEPWKLVLTVEQIRYGVVFATTIFGCPFTIFNFIIAARLYTLVKVGVVTF